jgi:hypothetical protein
MNTEQEIYYQIEQIDNDCYITKETQIEKKTKA